MVRVEIEIDAIDSTDAADLVRRIARMIDEGYICGEGFTVRDIGSEDEDNEEPDDDGPGAITRLADIED